MFWDKEILFVFSCSDILLSKSLGGTNNTQSKGFSLFPKMCHQKNFRKPTNLNDCNNLLEVRMDVMDPDMQ